MDKFVQQTYASDGEWHVAGQVFPINKKIATVKAAHKKYGMGLKEAKQYVEYLQSNPNTPFDGQMWVRTVRGEEGVKSLPEIPVSVEGTIRIGSLRYSVDISADNLTQVVEELTALAKAVVPIIEAHQDL